MKGVVIVAAGNSCRFGSNKLQQDLLDKTVLQTTVDLFDGLADHIVVVGDFSPLEFACDVTVVEGGETRQQSVANGLTALDKRCEVVAIHDGARPFVSRDLIQKLFDEASKFSSAVPCLPVTDTLWQQHDNTLAPQQRNDYFTVQTPQVFNLQKLLAAFEKAEKTYTDESTLFFDRYGDVHFVEGEFSNKKITVPADLPQFSVGVGFDVHAFGCGNGVILGGVTVPFPKKLVGHSDADVLTHAICDAVLTASGNRDIGVQFPDTDNKYLGANSLHLLAECVNLAKKNGFSVESVSAVVICQQPKLAGYLPQMAQNLAAVLMVSPQCVNLSATTTEHLGALGNGDGIAAQAQALLSKKGLRVQRR